MSRPQVFVSRLIPEEGLQPLRRECDVEVNPEDRALTKDELIAGVQGKDALLCLLTDTIDADVVNANPDLKVISNYAVGYNNIDVAAATSRGIPVTNTPGVLTETSADMAWLLMMAVARRLVEADAFTRAGKFHGWGPMMLLGSDVYGKTLGIIGLGRIGRAMARRARGFDMRVLYFNRNPLSAAEEQELGATYTPLEDVLRDADYVSIHIPQSAETVGLIGARELELMGPDAYLINTSRGPIVDETALVAALREGKIAGAGLDVFEREPELAPGLVELDNVVLAPHIASATRETRGKMAAMAAENLLAVLQGNKPRFLVNEQVWRRSG